MGKYGGRSSPSRSSPSPSSSSPSSPSPSSSRSSSNYQPTSTSPSPSKTSVVSKNEDKTLQPSITSNIASSALGSMIGYTISRYIFSGSDDKKPSNNSCDSLYRDLMKCLKDHSTDDDAYACKQVYQIYNQCKNGNI